MSRTIGIPKEIKNHEYRVGLTPAGARQLTEAGHEVWVEANAGTMIGFSDTMYAEAGARIVSSAEEVYACEMIVKVKEPQPSEYALLQKGQMLFCFLHLAPDPEQTKALVESKVTAIAYETVTDRHSRLPLLEPMSEIAGRLSIQIGVHYLQINNGGRGLLLGGVPGVLPAHVVVLGGGVAGTEAARMAMGLGATVTVIDRDLNRLRHLDALYGSTLYTLYSNSFNIETALKEADLLVSAVLIPGKKAPKLVTKKMVSQMRPGSVLIDVAIDQGGSCETSRPTSHANPIYHVDKVIHYCVTNMPGVAARSSTLALTNATLQPIMNLASHGLQALKEDIHLGNGLNVYQGQITNEAVANDLGYPYISVQKALG